MGERLFGPGPLQRWVEDLWRAAGSTDDEARLTAEHLVLANLSGHDSHGVGMVPRYVQAWLADELRLNQHLAVRSDTGTMLALDGRRGMGQVVAHQAMALAIERARVHGVCVAGLRHSHHLGRVGHWAEQAVAAGMVSIHFVNAMSQPIVAPFGGREGRFVTNPFTVGIPVPGRAPLLLDFATSAIAMGKVRVAHLSGKTVSTDALLDAAGQPSGDPAVMFPAPGQRPGALRPFAAHKGYALAMVVEVLAAALTGGETTRPANLHYRYAVWNNMLAIVFDPQRLGAADAFGAEVREFVEWVRSAPLQDGSDAIRMPGDPERESRQARAAAIPLDAGSVAELDAAAAAVARATGRTLPPLSALAIAPPSP
jgi:uncharacterized oxidoreductase